MIPILKAIFGILAGDPTLAGKLPVYHQGQEDEAPNIFDGTAPPDAEYPYIAATTPDSTPGASQATDRMLYTADIYDYSPDLTMAGELAAQVEKLILNARPVPEGRRYINATRQFRERIIEDDTKVQHIHLEFLIRYGRTDLWT